MLLSDWSKVAFRSLYYVEKHHQNTPRSRAATPPDLEHPQMVGVSVWSGLMCKIGIVQKVSHESTKREKTISRIVGTSATSCCIILANSLLVTF